MNTIYLDYNATTPVAPAVAEAMMEVLHRHHGNPSSTHPLGHDAHQRVEDSRARVAALVGVEPEDIIFTSGGSEANNLAIKGVAEKAGKGRIISQITEHPSVLAPLAYLESHGFDVVLLPVDDTGLVDPEAVRAAITPDTILITIHHANNETGTIQSLEAIAGIGKTHGVPVHTDAAQTAGKIPLNAAGLGVDMMIAGHKLYGPKGIGALASRGGLALEPQIHGAGHERGRRAGTEAVHQIVGLGMACQLAAEQLEVSSTRLLELREVLHGRLREAIDGLRLHGHPEHRLPNTLNLGFAGVSGAELLAAAPVVAASTGSACHAGETRLSPVLEAMTVPLESGRGAVRISLGKPTTEAEVENAAAALIEAYNGLAETG